MKKINVKLTSFVFTILSMLILGGFAVKNGIAPGGSGGIIPDPNPGD